MKNYVITIARGFGSGGKDIATRLGEALGIPCYERQILTMASDQSGIDESVFVETDEKLRGKHLANFLRRMPVSGVVEPMEKDFISDVNVFNIQADIIRTLANTESCIIVGKCADVSEKRANYLIHTTDKYRAKYYSYYTSGKDWTNPTNYDLVLNSDRIGREKCVQLIQEYIKIRFPEKTVSE